MVRPVLSLLLSCMFCVQLLCTPPRKFVSLSRVVSVEMGVQILARAHVSHRRTLCAPAWVPMATSHVPARQATAQRETNAYPLCFGRWGPGAHAPCRAAAAHRHTTGPASPAHVGSSKLITCCVTSRALSYMLRVSLQFYLWTHPSAPAVLMSCVHATPSHVAHVSCRELA